MTPEKTILVSGYFSSIVQPDKLAYFERLDTALQKQGYRIVLLSQTSEKLKTSCTYERVPRFILRAERLHLGYLCGQPVDDISRHAASIVAEKEKIPLRDCVAKVKLFQHFILSTLRKYKPSAVLVWHEFNAYHYSISALLSEHNIPSLFVEYGALPGTVNFDRHGQMAKSWIAGLSHDSDPLRVDDSDLERATDFLEKLHKNQQLRRPGDPQKKLSGRFESKRTAGKPVVFYAGQNDFAAGILPVTLPDAKVHSPHFEDTQDALMEILHLARQNDWTVLFKSHPLDRREWDSVAGEFEDVLCIENEANILACIEESDVTVTILSQVSYLALIGNKACVLLGRSQMSGKGCAYEITTRDDTGPTIAAALNREDYETHSRLWDRHVSQLIRHYLLPYTEDVEPFFNESADEVSEMIIHFGEGKETAKIDGAVAAKQGPTVDYADPAPRVSFHFYLLYALEPVLWTFEKFRSLVSHAKSQE